LTVIPILRLVRGGVLTAVAVGLTGWGVERLRFGASDDAAVVRVESELRQRVEASADTLGVLAARVAAARETIRRAPRDQTALRALFDVVSAALPDERAASPGITVYDPDGAPLAWAGRTFDLPKQRVDGPATLFVAPSALGPRLVRIEPIADSGASASDATPRMATIVVEQSLAAVPGVPGLADTFVISTSLVPVTLRTALPSSGQEAARSPYSFVIPSRGGGVLVEAEVLPASLAAARDEWRRFSAAAVLAVFAVTLLLCAGPVLEARRRSGDLRTVLITTPGLLVIVLGAWTILWVGTATATGSRSLTSPPALLFSALAAAAVAWLAIDIIERGRLTRPRLLLSAARSGTIIAAAYAVAGVADLSLLWIYERGLQRVISHTTLDLLHFSLHPINGARLGLAFALVLLHAAVVWGAAAIVLAPATLWRTPRAVRWRVIQTGAWLIGIVAGVAAASALAPPLPIAPLGVALVVAGAAALTLARVSGRLRRASQAARIFTVFLALLAPAVAMYPSVLAFATDAKERLVATQYGPEAASQREDLERRLRRSLAQIDALPSLSDFVAGFDVTTPTTDRAFVVWSRTDLAVYRLTSSVELFTADGRLVSRFALIPEYATTRYRATACRWEELVDEVSPFGSSERRVVRTARGICERGRILGGIVVRVMLDPSTLPFMSDQSPYLQSLRLNRLAPPEGVSGRDVEFAMYGWSKAPIFAVGTSVWPMPDDVFQRMVTSRAPFWTTIGRNGDTFRVYLQNDRGAIYALGYPLITWFGHLINLAELVLLTAVLYAALLLLATLFSAAAFHTPASGRALLREVRSSFYLKLFLAFVASVVVPVAILAVATRTYFANQLRAGVVEAAARTVTTAQRLVEDYATLQQRGPGAINVIDDQIMVLVRRAIDEDVNLFDRQRLQATSARDLFASQLLSTRTPGDVYKTVLLDRLPTFVGEEEVGALGYRLAAAPVRAGSRDGIVTVALANRQQEIEQQIDELDRRVLSGAVLFSLLGAALGYWMAERIADPVNRLTRATRRIARGDLDARIAATSSDELRRLVEDFNQMAADLKRQRIELEHTQRLQAWADMARQVAHDIKNPLTPIQLSAEHARRVNLDRGRPLSPVLDECVDAILTQVKLLRQIAAEFSSFASSPTPRPEPTALPAVLEEVVEPYRTGLGGRIAITVDAPTDLPLVVVDRTLFARALTNIIENALHAMPGQGRLTIAARPEPAVASGARASLAAVSAVGSGALPSATAGAAPAVASGVGGTRLVVEISDTGIGMDRESVAKIFEPYFSTKATGTGLGLTIAKRNVELNGGTIHVRSQRGVGTTVTILLPVD
jgi:signal transduction histidine kinase